MTVRQFREHAAMLLNGTGLTPCLERLKARGVTLRRILDVGAHKGTWTQQARRSYPEAHFVLVEPIEFEELRAFDDVHHALLYSHEAEVDWYEKRNSGLLAAEARPRPDGDLDCIAHTLCASLPPWIGDSIYREATSHFAATQPVKRPTTTLQSLFGDGVDPASRFDLIKLDVQGAELAVLQGGEALVRQCAFLLLELPFMGMYNHGAPSFAESIAYLDGLGFVPYDLPEMHRESGVLLQIDILFVAREHPLVEQCQEAIRKLGADGVAY